MSNAMELRDASDVTTFRKQRATIQNYYQLTSKGQMPVGGISHTDLMNIARYGATYIPTSSLTVIQTTSSEFVYNTTEIVAQPCVSCSGSSYEPLFFTQVFPQPKRESWSPLTTIPVIPISGVP